MSGYFTDKSTHSLTKKATRVYRGSAPYSNTDILTWNSSVTSFRSGRRAEEKVGTQSNAEILASAKDNGRSYADQFDTGHVFESRKESNRFSHPNVKIQGINGTSYDGMLRPYFSMSGETSYEFPAPIAVNTAYYGALAINKTYPTRPEAGLNQFVGELDRLPSEWLLNERALWSKVDFFREIGSGYLNIAFGWMPFVKDLTNMFRSIAKSSEIINQYLRDSGRNVRRRYEFEPVFRTQRDTFRNPYGPLNYVSDYDNMGDLYGPHISTWNQDVIRTRSSEEKYWFSGAYTYYVNDGQDLLSKVRAAEQLANHLLGIRLTPDLLYELMPYSWLIDWWSNLGTITQNAVAFKNDNLVLRYGYLMRTCTQRDVYTVSGIRFNNYDPGTIAMVKSVITKSRVRSTPYGFGLDPNAFSAKQWAILGALGMSKAPTSLRSK